MPLPPIEPGDANLEITPASSAVLRPVASAEARQEVHGKPEPSIGAGAEKRSSNPRKRAESVFGRCLRPDGTAYARCRLRLTEIVQAPGDWTKSRTFRIESDGSGCFQHTVKTRLAENSRRTITIAETDSFGNEMARVVVDLSFAIDKAPHDLGALVLEPAPGVIAGKVVDELGRPLADATLRYHSWFDCGGVVFGPTEPSPFADLVRTDERGDFRFYGWIDAQDLIVWVEKDGYFIERTEFFDGDAFRVPNRTNDALFVLHRGGTLRGEVLVDPEASPGTFRLELAAGPVLDPPLQEPDRTNVDAFTFRAQRLETNPDEQGSFQFSAVQPGNVCLRVYFGKENLDETPLLEIDGIFVVAGATTVDPRLDPIDLRDFLHLRATR